MIKYLTITVLLMIGLGNLSFAQTLNEHQLQAKEELHELYDYVVKKEKNGELKSVVGISNNAAVQKILQDAVSDYDFVVKLSEADVDPQIITLFKEEIKSFNQLHRAKDKAKK